jgi:hypothetical protein
MSSNTSRSGCPVMHSGSFVPPRFQHGPVTTGLNLGPLAPLVGSWRGYGFNAIWRPDNPESPPQSMVKRFLELNLTSESFDFHVIPGVVPNRGLAPQTDLSLYGLHYLQRVSDADQPPFSTAGEALHIEPGLFMSVPESTSPPNPASIVRMASIPHGVTVMMQGPTPSAVAVPGPPVIPPIFPLPEFPTFTPMAPIEGLGIQPVNLPIPPPPPVEHQIPEVTLSLDTAGTQSNGPYPPATIPQSYVDDPNVVLRNAIAHQTILGTVTISLDSTAADSQIGNIPFLGNLTNTYNTPFSANAFVESARSTFWIEWVRPHGVPPSPVKAEAANPYTKLLEPFWPEPTYLQLQYSQVVILVFNKVRWPHVTVATLTLSAG